MCSPLARRLTPLLPVMLLVGGLALRTPTADAAPASSILVLADSVALGTRTELAQALPGHTITMTGFPGVTTADAPELAQPHLGAVGDIAIVVLGYNPGPWDPVRLADEVDVLVEQLVNAGAKDVIWLNLREPEPWNSGDGRWTFVQLLTWGDLWPVYNDILHDALDRHPELTIADWNSIPTDTSFVTDAIHLTPKGKTAMVELIRQEVHQLPRRINSSAPQALRIGGRGPVPVDATGALLRVTAIDARNRTAISVHACDQPDSPQFSADANQPTGATAFVELNPAGDACVTASHPTHLTVDVQGWTTPGDAVQPIDPAVVFSAAIGPADGTVTLDTSTETGTGLLQVGARGPVAGAIDVFPCANPGRATRLTFPADRRISDVRPISFDGSGLCASTSQRARVTATLLGASNIAVPAATPARIYARRAPTAALTTPARIDVGALGYQAGDRLSLSVRTQRATHPGTVKVKPCGSIDKPSHEATAAVDQNTITAVSLRVGDDAAVCVSSTSTTDILIDVDAVWPRGSMQMSAPFEVFDSRRALQRNPTLDTARTRTRPIDEDFALRD